MNENVQQLRVLAAQLNQIADAMERTAPAPAHPANPAPPPASAGSLYGGPPIAGSGPCAPPFGKCAGQPLRQLEDRDLVFYRSAIERSLGDPTKARYAAANQRMLADIMAEQNARAPR